jgi:hypothetical protein
MLHVLIILFIFLDNALSNRQHMSTYDYCRQLLGKLIRIVDDLKPVLIKIPVEGAGLFVKIEHTIINSLPLLYIILDRLLENLEIPLSQHNKMVFKEPLETFADILQVSSEILNQFNSENNAHYSGEESNETAERRISGMIFLYA